VGETRTESTPQVEPRTGVLPPYAVILHNDDVNEMGHVVRSLRKSVPSLTLERATDIMLAAHSQGRALVIVCPLELAELYQSRLQSCQLTATVEKA
jgi:ATP-dependent Clp protease adaptor protein ClpS